MTFFVFSESSIFPRPFKTNFPNFYSGDNEAHLPVTNSIITTNQIFFNSISKPKPNSDPYLLPPKSRLKIHPQKLAQIKTEIYPAPKPALNSDRKFIQAAKTEPKFRPKFTPPQIQSQNLDKNIHTYIQPSVEPKFTSTSSPKYDSLKKKRVNPIPRSKTLTLTLKSTPDPAPKLRLLIKP